MRPVKYTIALSLLVLATDAAAALAGVVAGRDPRIDERPTDRATAVAAILHRRDLPSGWRTQPVTTSGLQKWPRCARLSPNLSDITIHGQAASRHMRRSHLRHQTVTTTITLVDSKREADELFDALARPFGASCLSASISEVGSYELETAHGAISGPKITYSATLVQRGGRRVHVDYEFLALGTAFITFALTGQPGHSNWKLESALSTKVLLRLSS